MLWDTGVVYASSLGRYNQQPTRLALPCFWHGAHSIMFGVAAVHAKFNRLYPD